MKFLDILALFAIFYFFHTLTHSFPSYFKEKIFPSPSQSYTRRLQSTQDQDEASVINAFLNIFRLNTFCGSWEPTSRITQTDQYFSISSDKEKLVIINTTYSMSFNLILFESRYIDQGFMVLPINYTNLLENLDYTTMTVDLKNQDILYGTGRNIITNFVENINSCQIQEAKMSFYNGDTKKPFASLNDDVQDLRIDLQIKSQNCLFSFDAYSLMTCDQSSLQSWFYLLLNLIKVILSFNGTIVHFDRGLSEKTIQLQFTLLFALNCYIYFINVELVHSLAPAIFLIIPLSLFSIALDYTVLLKSFERCTALVITFVCVTICSILLFADNGVYWILVPFLAIPIIDFTKIFLPLNQYKHAFSVYLYYLLPSYCLLGFIKANPDNFARLTPNPDLVVICGIAFLVGLGIVKVGITIQHIKAEKRKARYFVELKEISRQDVCPICMNRLTRKKKKEQKNQADLEAPLIESSDDSIISEASDAQGEAEPVQDRIIKTPCDHKFHEKCLNQWLERKVECPYCRKPIPELA